MTVPETTTPCPRANPLNNATARTTSVRSARRGISLFEDPAKDFREPFACVVEHHDHEQERDGREPEAKDVFASPEAERTALCRFHHVQENLSAVEDRDR